MWDWPLTRSVLAGPCRAHGLTERGGDAGLLGDKGHIGMGMLTPIRRAPGQEHPHRNHHRRHRAPFPQEGIMNKLPEVSTSHKDELVKVGTQ